MRKERNRTTNHSIRRKLLTTLLLFMTLANVSAEEIAGIITDSKTNEVLVGVVIEIKGSNEKTISDIDGKFAFNDLKNGTYTILCKYVGYKTQEIDGVQAKTSSENTTLKVMMKSDEQQLQGVTVTAVERKNTVTAAIQQVKNSPVIVSNVSAQEISKTQDTNAGEVIRRIPGISLIDDKFVMVRGLSQRYNNVWINGGAVPSSEADSRAFSFDIIPSSQIDNLTIVKTPSPEYPSDYSGGFIIIDTKEIPSTNSSSFSIGGNWNDASAFRTFYRNQRNDSWFTKKQTPLGDLKLSASLNHKWNISGNTLGLIATINYTNEYRSYTDMVNNLFGVYDAENDKENYLRKSTDEQYNNNCRLGAMLNLTWLSKNGKNKYQFKNIFNSLTNNRYTWREGVSAQADLEKSAEYYYRSRTTYNGQFTGKHTFSGDILDWSAGYAYANRRLPDRRRYLINDALESGVYALSTGNDISKEWTKLNENILSANLNERHDLHFGSWNPFLKVGAYGEYRTREYTTKEYIYNWNADNNTLPDNFRYMDLPTLLSDKSNYGDDKLYLLEQLRWTNNYRGNNTLGAGYLAASLPFGKLNVYTGIRFEHNDMELITNTKDSKKSETSRHYKSDDFFPSLNAIYKLNDQNQLRFSYGRSINRPEFREISPSVYYDFDLASNVQGNSELKSCYIQNIDLRYEYYPTHGEQISMALFYKHFDSPIEWTYTVTGGTDLTYSYQNAQSANNYGIELDIRKDLSFIGLSGLSWSFNGALIKSKVHFSDGSNEKNRPMQGQSPYLINTGLFYTNEPHHWNAALLYNRIGKRIIGVGRSEGTTGSDENANVPDSYEMPRNTIDMTASKKWGIHWEVKCYIRDLLAEKVYYKQFADVKYQNGNSQTVEEITKMYKPGRNIGLQIIYSF